MGTADLSIGEVAARTGVPEGTLRMWERRHGFPASERTARGHRRYSEQQLELVRRVGAARAAGVSLHVAIERVRATHQERATSLFATLCRRHPELEARLLTHPLMRSFSHAIEDETLARAERPFLFAAFQRERFYRREQSRWRELADGARMAVVFADFPVPVVSGRGPAEVPISHADPLAREWALVCDSDGYAVCLSGRERASSHPGRPSASRVYEAVWSVDPEIVRAAARICAEMAAHALPEDLASVAGRLDAAPAVPAREQLRLATSITNRLLSDPAVIHPVPDPVIRT